MIEDNIMECQSKEDFIEYLVYRTEKNDGNNEDIQIRVFDIIMDTFMPSVAHLCRVYEWVIKLESTGHIIGSHFEKINNQKYLIVTLDTMHPGVIHLL